MEVNNASNTEGNKNSEGDSNYKIWYDNRPIKCIWCDVSVRADGLPRHQNSKKHIQNVNSKYKVISNGKEYVYDKSKRISTVERLKDPEKKKKHYDTLKKKVECELCGTKVNYSSMWRHKVSNKCKKLSSNN